MNLNNVKIRALYPGGFTAHDSAAAGRQGSRRVRRHRTTQHGRYLDIVAAFCQVFGFEVDSGYWRLSDGESRSQFDVLTILRNYQAGGHKYFSLGRGYWVVSPEQRRRLCSLT